MRHISSSLSALALVAALSVAAHAAPLFSAPGGVTCEAVTPPIAEPAGDLVGVDADGVWGYLVRGNPGWPDRLDLIWPDGSLRSQDLFGDFHGAGLSWDGAAFLVVDRAGDDWRLSRVTAAEVPEASSATPPEPLVTFGPGVLPALGEPNPTLPASGFRGTPAGGVCWPAPAGLLCVTPGESPPATLRLDAAELGARIPTLSDWIVSVLVAGETAPSRIDWEVALTTPMPDGRVAALIRQEIVGTAAARTTGTVRTTVLSMLVVAPDGAAEVVFGPVPETAASAHDPWTPLRGTDRLLWLEDLEAIAATTSAWDIGWSTLTNTAGAWRGDGLRLVRPADHGSGYLSSTDALHRQRPAADGGYTYRSTAQSFIPDGSGLLAALGWASSNQVDRVTTYCRLGWQADTLDLDSDGLDAATEATLGTSDWWADSDGGGTLDGVEALLEGTSPMDWRDDGAAIHDAAREVWLVDSPLIRMRLPDAPIDATPVRSWGIDGPLCVGGTCWAPDGSVALRYGPTSAEGVSADGRFLAQSPDGTAVQRTWFDDGRTEVYLDAETISGAAPDGDYRVTRVVPIDAERTWLEMSWTRQGRDAAVLFCRAGGCALAFDPAAERAEAGITRPWYESQDAGLHDVYVDRLRTVAWDPVNEALLVQIVGPLDAWLLALTEDRAPFVLERAHTWEAANLPVFDQLPILERAPVTTPDWAVWQPEGDLFGPKGLVSPSRRFLPTGLSMLPHLDAPPAVGWGGAMLTSVCCGDHEDGLYEIARYERALDPGDVLLLKPVGNSAERYGYQLFKSGPRGGLVPLWRDVNREVGDVGGMDATADGSLCVTDRERELLWLFAPSKPEDRVPDLVIDAPSVPGVIDCLFDRDTPGDVLMLVDDPPRFLRRRGETGEIVDEKAPGRAFPDRPRDLLWRPNGSLDVVGDEVRGKAYLADGRPVVVSAEDFGVTVDGQGVAALRLATIDYETPLSPSHPIAASVAVRPDGLVVIVGVDNQQGLGALTEPWVVDPETGDVALLGIDRLWGDGGGAVAVVPGGVAADPWTGAPVGGPPAPDYGVEVPVAPSGGAVRLREEPIGSGGCAGGGGGPWALAAWAAIALAWRRRRRL